MTRSEPLPQQLYRLLSDREFHSGTELAAACAVSRSAVWKAMASLRALGVTVHAVANRGYRLPGATALLEVPPIRRALREPVAQRLRQGESLWSTGSTNADLLQRPGVPVGQFDFLSAEFQSAGRGRRARSWYAPPGGAVCLSFSWSFATLPAGVAALSLAIGVCALRALRAAGVEGAALKWPNDLVARGGKLGGILIELRAEAAGPAYVVVGIGCNVALGAAVAAQVQASGTRSIDLHALGIEHCDRNQLVAAILSRCVEGLLQFERDGFASFAGEWRAADALAGKAVAVSSEAGSINGHARGIDLEGALCVQTRDGVQRFVSGDVSVRTET